LSKNVVFMGRVPRKDIPLLINKAAIYVLPSLYEGMPYSLLEAMACGIPVIVSNVSALPEVVGDAGLRVDPQNISELAVGMHRLLVDKGLREEMIQKGLARAACFSWDKAARETLEVYRKVSQSR